MKDLIVLLVNKQKWDSNQGGLKEGWCISVLTGNPGKKQMVRADVHWGNM